MIIPTPLLKLVPPCNIKSDSSSMTTSETKSLVNSLGPIVELSALELALMVMIALRRSPAADWILALTSGRKNAISLFIKSCSLSKSMIPEELSGLSVLITFRRKSTSAGLSTCLRNLSTMLV
ncbi:hypothetical protein WICPIJ_002569 [Wickerhamomyces pijperi]|uniref:Uncharacterized protein n=1 Tax=Wickerhamomyces pijperi TaxID=599730 RepID=A0A9P8QBH7_WICPI|nr:hypothetical protein WICPIJ_002569 [Wickerhamomyces pijperi]